MVDIKIAHNHYEPVMGLFCQPLDLDINHAVKKSMKPLEKLTTEKALKVLRKIEIMSKIQSFFTKPIVAVSITLAATIGGYIATAFTAWSLALGILGLTFAVAGTLAFGLAVRSACDGSLNKMSTGYGERGRLAHEYIQQIKNAQKNGYAEIRVLV